MSFTTNSVILLSALGLAACSSSDNTTAAIDPAVEIETATRAAAIADVTVAEANDPVTGAEDGVYVTRTVSSPITLADGTELETAGVAIYTRLGDPETDPDGVLAPTVTLIAAYEVDEAGGYPTSIAFYEADGIAFEGAPEGTATASGIGGSVGFVQLNDLDGVVVSDEMALLTLDFNTETGTFEAFMQGESSTAYAYLDIIADLTFDVATGEFISTGGVTGASYESEDAFLESNLLNLDLAGNLHGAAEAFSGEFTADGSGFDAAGLFGGVAVPVQAAQ